MVVPHGAQRDHRRGRAAADAGRARCRQRACAGQQGVADHRRPGGARPCEARPDRARRQRAQCARAVPAGRSRRRGTTARADRQRGTVPRAQPVRPRRRDAGAGHGPSDLGHGAGRHDQLRDPGQQGARGDRGAPPVRHPDGRHRGGRAPDLGRPLDGRVQRRVHARPGLAPDDGDPDRARPGLARPGARHGAGGGLVDRADLGVLPARRRGVPRRAPGPRGGCTGQHGARRSTTRPTRCACRRSATETSRSSTSSTRWRRSFPPTTYPLGEISPSTTCSRPMPGPARGRPPHWEQPLDDRVDLPARRAALPRGAGGVRGARTSSGT